MSQLQEASPRAGASGASAGPAPSSDFYSHQIANSARCDTNTGYLKRTPSSAGNRATWTFSTWVKRSTFSSGSTHIIYSAGTSGDQDGYYRLYWYQDSFIISSANANFATPSDKFRDPSAWYHIVWKQGSNATTLYVNNRQVTTASVSGNTAVNNNVQQVIANNSMTLGDSPMGGYIAETIMIDGTALDPTSFGESKNGVWIPKDASGLTYGTNGFRLSYGNASDLGEDSAGSNDWTAVNLATHDQFTDTPTFNSTSNGGNFMTYNGILIGSNNNLAEGNLKSTGSAAGNNSGNFGMVTGKWYWECKASTVSAYAPTFGIGQTGHAGTDGLYYIITWQTSAGQIYTGGGSPVGMGTISSNSTGVTTLSSGDILSFWLDCDNGKLWIGKNGTIPNSGDPASGTNPQASWSSIPEERFFTPTCQNVSSGVGILNAGQNPSFNGTQTAGTYTDKNGYGLFVYDPSATDFIACCAANLPTNTLVSPAETDDNYPQKLFGAYTYTGNNDGDRTVSTDFQADKVWIKVRSIVDNHYIQDSTRGFGFSKSISPNATGAEGANGGAPTTTKVDSVSSSNMVVTGADFTYSSATYVAWLWRANGGTTSSNSNGSITSTVQVDPSGCFSIVTYTGQSTAATVGHGLSSAPDFIMVKSIDDTRNWAVYYGDTGKALQLNNYNAADSGSYWNSTAPTSSVFSVNDVSETGKSEDYVAYVFSNCSGYIQSGTYVGNGSTDGAFVYTGLRPAWIMCKRVDSSSFGNWRVMDNARDPNNVGDRSLLPNSTQAEEGGSSDYVDLLSNGFKLRNTANWNSSGGTYAYLAMAKNPFQFATAR